ncbi:thrombospondin type 3 repeat-containing protein, partial [Vibrio campbellii]|uniref:thrombospondin type 3 repeat-containing protein n=1 Tax=Vibrio campbellii TaxID=680 RepID=UPI0015E3E5E5
EATQKSTTTGASRTLTGDFVFSDDEVHGLLALSRPLLQHETPLHPNDEIGLQNETDVVSEVADFLASTTDVTVTYLWEVRADSGDNWDAVDAGDATYRDLEGPLTQGAQYRLALLGHNPVSGEGQRIESAPSGEVVMETETDYDIVLGLLSTPQVGVPLGIESELRLNGEATSFDARVVRWVPITAEGTRLNEIERDRITPPVSQVGYRYEVTVVYQLGGVDVVSETVLSEAVPQSFASPPDSQDIDGDGIPNEWDADMDGDGVVNELDVSPEIASEAHDIDGDGTADDTTDLNIRRVDIVSDQSYTISSQEIVRFVPISLANGGEISTASAYLGRISIVDNTLLYVAPLELPQQLYIEYTVTMPDGSTENNLLLLVNDSLEPDSPRFVDVSPVDILATGLFTPIRDLAPEATDVLGNTLPVSLETGQVRLRPGNNVVYWRASDESLDTTQLSAQLIRIHPQVDFGQGRVIYEGAQASVSVYLNGLSPIYPLTIPIVLEPIFGTSDESDHSLSMIQDVVIDSGRYGTLRFEVTADGEDEGIETLALALGDGVNAGPNGLKMLEIHETSPRPEIRAQVVDERGDRQSLVASELDNALYLEVVMVGASMPLELDWSHRHGRSDIVSLGTVSSDTALRVPWPLDTGRHRFYVKGTSLDMAGEPVFSSIDIRVLDTTRLSFDVDSDNDGVSDLAEGMTDSDGDLIPDYLDAVNSCELQVIDNERAGNGGFVLQSSAGSCVMLGQVSEQMGAYSPYVRGEGAVTEASIPIDEAYTRQFNNSDLSNFVITNVLEESVSIVLPLMQPYSEGGVFRKYTQDSGWFDFDTTEEGSALRYALGEFGFCPPPGSIQYQESPLIGANCLEVTLRDGGLHDSDGVRNGVVDDPAYMVYLDREYVFSPIVITHYYNPRLRLGEHEVPFDVCDYIDVTPCDINITSFSTNLALDSVIEGTEVFVYVPSGEKTVAGHTQIELDGVAYRIDTTIHLIAHQEDSPPSVENKRVSGGALGLWWLCFSMLLLWRAQKRGALTRR